MAIVSYRLYCTDCTNDKVIKEDRMSDHQWKLKSKVNHEGLCPACNPNIDPNDDSEYARQHDEVAFEELNDIGDTGAENLRDEGIVTRQDVANASDDEILSVPWVGEGGLDSIRQEVQL